MNNQNAGITSTHQSLTVQSVVQLLTVPFPTARGFTATLELSMTPSYRGEWYDPGCFSRRSVIRKYMIQYRLMPSNPTFSESFCTNRSFALSLIPTIVVPIRAEESPGHEN